MSDELGPVDYLNRHWQTTGEGVQQKLDELVELTAGNSGNAELYREMLHGVVRMAQADRNRWDAKIMLQTIRELEQAFARLDQFKRSRKVTVFGSARTPREHPAYKLAQDMGRQLARHDFMAITGGGGGIMAATHEGAGLDNSLGFNITLPFEQRSNHVIHETDHDLPFKFFFLRKLFFVKEADALILCPGGFGTLDETLEVLTLIQTGKSPVVPVILLDTPDGNYWSSLLQFLNEQLCANGYIHEADFRLISLVHSAEDAIQVVLNFYRNYHSSRWINSHYLLRLNHPLKHNALRQLEQQFADICVEDGFCQDQDCRQELDEPEFSHLHRLSFRFNGRDHGRLRELIDFVNQPEHLQN
ncbi:LOG family protein [Pseudomonas jilinensis]|uniref:AMP nucleosidase n=1 Tax=Pseudomonas jilinensis TaxID=2078689 RepID=A0A396RYS9_9PSED|nr:LOG family protein [Pseudomonas jilinensis]RHW21784.1 cytochrome D ubiquinol oxidase subunit II [Pseudomonas jilinensis]